MAGSTTREYFRRQTVENLRKEKQHMLDSIRVLEQQAAQFGDQEYKKGIANLRKQVRMINQVIAEKTR